MELWAASVEMTILGFDNFGVQREQTKANAGPSTALLTKCVSNFAQDDSYLEADGQGQTTANTNTGVLRCAQDDSKDKSVKKAWTCG